MKNSQITLIIFFKITGFRNKYWAFSQMLISYYRLKNIVGLNFFKSLGTGGGNGFDLTPNFSNYCWLMVWESEEQAREFLQTNLYFNEYQNKCQSSEILFLKNIISKGLWSKVNPFEKTDDIIENENVLVLTRASIKLSKLIYFWIKVGNIVKKLYSSSDLKLAVGVGELPLIQQATISIWNNKDAINKFAYEDKTHLEIVNLTRKYSWYKEELFARFQITDQIKKQKNKI